MHLGVTTKRHYIPTRANRNLSISVYHLLFWNVRSQYEAMNSQLCDYSNTVDDLIYPTFYTATFFFE